MAKEVPERELREKHDWVGQARVWRGGSPGHKLSRPLPGPFGVHPGAARLLLALSTRRWHFQCGQARLGASTGDVPAA